jgi:hypothetical protein
MASGNKLPDPLELQKFFEAWWRTGSTIVVTLAGVLASLQIPSSLAYIIALGVTGIGIAFAIAVHRREARARERDEVTKEKTSSNPLGGAFRGLRRFLRGELLPGPQRRRDGAQLLRQIVHPDFKIAVVTGDSGAGKSSLLECALVEGLSATGHAVAMVSNSTELVPAGPAGSLGSHVVKSVIAKILEEAAQRRVDESKAVVLILDQFEELISRFRAKEDRDELGDCLSALIAEGTRVVLGLRKEFLVDFRDFASRLSYQVSFADVFVVENFDTKEAAAAIRECAKEDGVTPDDELPELIADDLAMDGRVRPVDLQIICTALSGDLTIERYRREGRATGLRSRFIKGAIEIAGNAILARTVLRQLCDIPNNKKLAEPLSSYDIAEKALEVAPGQRATLETVSSVLEALEQARVLVKVNGPDGHRWSLIHDYLVEPIKLATEEQTTRNDMAAARLDYFVGRAKVAPGAIIPLTELSLIRQDAPPRALRDPIARRLIRRSLVVGYGRPIGIASAAALAAVLLVIGLSIIQQWTLVDEENHWAALRFPGMQSQGVSARVLNLRGDPLKPIVIVGGNRDSLTTWDGKTGKRLAVVSGKQLTIIDDWIWDYDDETGVLRRLDADGTEVLSLSTPEDGRPRKGSAVIWETKDSYLVFDSQDTAFKILNLTSNRWSSVDNEQIHPASTSASISGPGQRNYSYCPSLNADKAILTAVLCTGPAVSRLTIWTTGYEELVFDEQFPTVNTYLLAFSKFESTPILSFFKDKSIETITFRQSGDASVGQKRKFLLAERRQTPTPKDFPFSARDFTQPRVEGPDSGIMLLPGSTFVLFGELLQTRTDAWVLHPDTAALDSFLLPPTIEVTSSSTSRSQDYYTRTQGIAWVPWEAPATLKIWLLDESAPTSKQFILRKPYSIQLSADRRRMLFGLEDGEVELWDSSSQSGSPLMRSEVKAPISFSSDGKLVFQRYSGGWYRVWDADGDDLGFVGAIGSDLSSSLYRSDCRQILLWTREGARLDFRRGYFIPFYGFLPERDCSGNPPWTRRLFDRFSSYLAK